jgi:hypothetical protein
MRMLKCNKCGEKHPKDQLIYTSEKHKLCPSCFTDGNEYRYLIDNLCKLYNVDRPNGLWLSKIKTYREEGITYSQIWCVMDYIVRILGKKADEFTIMAVPTYYNSAKKLYESKWRFDNSLHQIKEPREDIKIRISEDNIIKPKVENTRIYNIGEI